MGGSAHTRGRSLDLPLCIGSGDGDVEVSSSFLHGDGADLWIQKAGNCGRRPRLAISYSAFTTKQELSATVDTSRGTT